MVQQPLFNRKIALPFTILVIGLFPFLIFSLIPQSQAQEDSLEGNYDLNGEWGAGDGDFFNITHTSSQVIASYYPDLGYCTLPGMKHIGSELVFEATIEGDQLQGQVNVCYEDTMTIELSDMQLRVTDDGNTLDGFYIGNDDRTQSPLRFQRVSGPSYGQSETTESMTNGEASIPNQNPNDEQSIPNQNPNNQDNILPPPFDRVVATSTEAFTNVFPTIVIGSIVVIGGIALGKYGKNRNNGRRIRIPSSAVVSIHTKGGKKE